MEKGPPQWARLIVYFYFIGWGEIVGQIFRGQVDNEGEYW